MKTYLDCYPCFIEQALRAARMVSADETLQQKLLNRILEVLIDFPTGATPPQIAHPPNLLSYKTTRIMIKKLTFPLRMISRMSSPKRKAISL